MTESFPDSLDAIRDAFKLPDHYPESTTICDIVLFYFELVEHSSHQVDKLTATLVNLKSSTEITIVAHDGLGKSVPISIGPRLGAPRVARQRTCPLARTNTSSPQYSPL